MPYKNREDYNAYMRDYQKKKNLKQKLIQEAQENKLKELLNK